MRRLIRSAGRLLGIEVPRFAMRRRRAVRPGMCMSDADAEPRSGLRMVIVVGFHALAAFTAATPSFASTADVARARELLVEATSVASGIDDIDLRRGVLREIAAAQARAGDTTAALTTAGSVGRS